MDVVDRQRVEVVPPLAPAPLGDDQVGLFEHFQMLHDRAAVDFRKMGAQRARRQWLILEVVEHLPPNLVAKGLENAVDPFRI